MANPGNGKAIKKGKKNRKHGRNKVSCARYMVENREAKNKARNVAKEARRQASHSFERGE